MRFTLEVKNVEELIGLELAPHSVVMQAARDFSFVLANTAQFTRFEHAADRLNKDAAAQQAIQAFQQRQQFLQTSGMMNGVNPEARIDLERLREAFLAEPSVIEYMKAQGELMTLCQAVAARISNAIGLNYAAACGASCCG
jgi:cell fate (sporulation/competence/biofilm development) regulator YlbF (YheA/YmcA/DUF963 family)